MGKGNESRALRRVEEGDAKFCTDEGRTAGDVDRRAANDCAGTGWTDFRGLPTALLGGGGASGESGLRRRGLARSFASRSSLLCRAFWMLDPDETMRADLRLGVEDEDDELAVASGVASVPRLDNNAGVLLCV